MKRFIQNAFLLTLLLLVPLACSRDLMEVDMPGENREEIPYGTPVTLTIPFGGNELYEVEVSTKAEAAGVNETHIHDLYVMIFDLDQKVSEGSFVNSPKKIFGRYYSYEHMKQTIEEVVADDNECWFVANKTLEGVVPAVAKTVGAVKVSTISCPHAKVVVIANVANAITNLDGDEPLDRLNAVAHYKELKGVEVCLEQNIVNRKDLFLMTGELGDNTTGVSTATMEWGEISAGIANYFDGGEGDGGKNFQVRLTPVDAKVKFRVRVNPQYISAATPVYWQVCNTPDRCYLYDDFDGVNAPPDIKYFESQQYYFEETKIEEEDINGDGIDEEVTYYTFCFYVLENRYTAHNHADNYYQRELRVKSDSGEDGYKGPSGPSSDSFGTHYVNNGEWRYAPTFGTYVQFDLVLTLTPDGIDYIRDYEPEGMDPEDLDPEGMKITQALTSDAIFTVHLGDFGNSDGSGAHNFDAYYTERGNYYTYNIIINNTRSIYAEVKYDRENQAGQEGFLLLTDSEIINADCHYEYHQIDFYYRPDMSQEKFSWYVKTPFSEGGPTITKHLDGTYSYAAPGLDYLWVKFGINDQVSPSYITSEGGDNPDPVSYPDEEHPGTRICPYSLKRHAYPGDDCYDPNWEPGQAPATGTDNNGDGVPDLMDITQLIQYIFYETNEKRNNRANAFIADDDDSTPVIRITAFIDEYYYETDPLTPGTSVNPDLWRKFINAAPRELHILADAQQSRDRKSDVILSSHSIIQQSIQTIYNIYSANLHSLWGTEHQDEMRRKTDGWPYWPKHHPTIPYTGEAHDGHAGAYDAIGKENGRLNSAYIWGFYSSTGNNGTETTPTGAENDPMQWGTYLNYRVHNNTPELKDSFHGMAYSCLTRNRDNNGNGVIDRDEVRWYLAACNQLVGMWIGNESLSIDARLYRPEDRQWRAHIFSSTDWRLSWSEEGGGATDYKTDYSGQWRAWNSQELASRGESVRCLRNIGTYTDGSGTHEITGAPYNIQPEQYFVITPTPNSNDPADTHYTFEFDNLNPKSLRELSESELPFHDQFNVSNCVYLKFETQSRADENSMPWAEGYPYPFYVDLQDVNPTITRLGYNPYCPPGYRLPNQSEQLLMSLYLPDNYRTKDGYNRSFKDYYYKDDPERRIYTQYPNAQGKFDELPAGTSSVSAYRPSRTYYDRGQYGLKTTGFIFEDDPGAMGSTYVQNREQGKSGWAWSDKLHCANTTDKMTRTRCVRDTDMTGAIEGGLLMTDVLYPGDEAPISFSFYSSGATFISASLKLCFTDHEGIYHERDIPVQSTPTGLQFLDHQTVTIPTLTGLGLTETDLANNPGLRNMKFKVTVRNAYKSETFEQAFTLGNPLEDFNLTLKGEAGFENELYPGGAKIVDINFSSKANTCTLHTLSISLEYTDKNGVTQTVPASSLGFPAFTADSSLEYRYLNRSLSIPDLGSSPGLLNFNLADLDDDAKNSAIFVVSATDNGGSSVTKSFPAKLANPLTFNLESEEYIYANELNPVTLAFQTRSTGTLDNVELQLLYDSETINLIASTNPGTKVYEATPNIDFRNQTIQALNLNPSDLTIHGDNPIPYKEMTLRAVLHESQGFEKTVERTLKLRSHIDAMSLEFPSTYDNDAGMPVSVSASLVTGKTATYSAAFDYKSYSGSWTSWQTWPTGTTAAAAATKYTTDMSGVSSVSDVVGANINKAYSYRFTVTCDDGTSFTRTRSMQLLRFNMAGNNTTWCDNVDNLRFDLGDYLEAEATMVYNILKKSGLLSIGNDISKWNDTNGTRVFHLYTGDSLTELRLRSNFIINKATGVGTGSSDVKRSSNDATLINIRFGKDGLFIDGALGNRSEGGWLSWSKNNSNYITLISDLTSASPTTIQIGHTQGSNHSYSTYHYIRVIREREIPAP